MMGEKEPLPYVFHAYLKDCLGGIALDIISVYDDLDDAIPHLLTDIVTGDAN